MEPWTKSEHSASQGSETAHLSQQEAHLYSTDLNNPQSIEVPRQHRSASLYSCPTVAYWPSRDTIPTSHLQKRPWGEKAKTRVPLSPPFPPARQWKSRVKELGQLGWKGLCPQAHWHVYHLPESHIKGGRKGGWQIKIEEAFNGGLSIVSEYERGRLRRQNWSGSAEWGVDGLRTCAPRESAAFEKVQLGWRSGFNDGGCSHDWLAAFSTEVWLYFHWYFGIITLSRAIFCLHLLNHVLCWLCTQNIFSHVVAV